MPDELLPAAVTPTCAYCHGPALVHWLRRATAAEMAGLSSAYQVLAADPGAGPFGPAPTAETSTVAIYACATHPITLDLASRVHAASCTAPNPATLPGCDCTPEATPAPEPLSQPTTTLSTGWTLPTTS